MEGVSRGQSRVYRKHPASGLVRHFSPAAAWPVWAICARNCHAVLGYGQLSKGRLVWFWLDLQTMQRAFILTRLTIALELSPGICVIKSTSPEMTWDQWFYRGHPRAVKWSSLSYQSPNANMVAGDSAVVWLSSLCCDCHSNREEDFPLS